jgi:hypothetical protein
LNAQDVKSFLTFPLVVLSGEKDTDSNHRNLRRTSEADAQGITRFARGQYFFNYGRAQAEKAGIPSGRRLRTVPGVGHNNAGMSAVAAALVAEDSVASFAKKKAARGVPKKPGDLKK